MADKISFITLSLAKKFTSDTAIGLGAIKGAPCILKSVEDVAGGKNFTYEWTATDGTTKQTRTVFFPNGIGIKDAYIDASDNLVLVRDDDAEIVVGTLPSGYDGAVVYKVDSLPTTGIDDTALYIYNGVIYEYDSVNGKWVEVLSGGSGDGTEYEFSTEGNNLVVTDTATGVKQSLPLPTSSAGGITNDLPVAIDVGGIKKSKTYPAGTSVEQIFNEMLNPVQNPTLTNPSATLSGNFPSMVKVGTEILAQTATVGLNRGRINPQYQATDQYRAGAATGYSLALSGASVTYSDSNNTGSFNVPAFTRNEKGNVTVTAKASHGAGVQPTNSIGESYSTPLAAGEVSTTKTIQFVIPFKYGVVTDRTAIDLNSLTDDVSGKESKIYTFATNNEYMVMAYDSAHGDLSEIIDSNGFDGTSGFEKVVMGDYYVYVANSTTTDDSATYKFNF